MKYEYWILLKYVQFMEGQGLLLLQILACMFEPSTIFYYVWFMETYMYEVGLVMLELCGVVNCFTKFMVSHVNFDHSFRQHFTIILQGLSLLLA